MISQEEREVSEEGGGMRRAGQLITRRISGSWDRSLKGKVWVMSDERPVVWAIK